MQYLTLEKWSAAIVRKANVIEIEIRRSELETAQKAKEMLRVDSSGPYKQAMLDEMGNPYGYSNGKPRKHLLTRYNLDPAIINIQTGRFKRSWGIKKPRKVGRNLNSEVTNSAPYAIDMLGKPNMIPRRIDIAVGKKIRRFRFDRARAALRAALRA
jgi:hypothetical protein